MAEKIKIEKTKLAFSEIGIYRDKNSPSWLQEIREQAFSHFQKSGLPTPKWELWKYTHLARLFKNDFAEAGSGKILSFSARDLPAGVILETFPQAAARRLEKMESFLAAGLNEESSPFVFLNTFSFQDGVFLYVPRDVVIEEPIEFIFSGQGHPGKAPLFSPRILLVLEEGAGAKVVVRQSSANPGAYFTNGVAEIYLAKKAGIHWVQADRQSSEASQFFTSRIYLQAESRLEMISFTDGGNITRHETEIALNGERSSVWVGGLSLLLGDSEVSDIVTVKHRASDGTSRQLFKNILAGHSQAEFTSLAHVGAGTHGSDSHQLNRNLILSDFAHAYSRPQLKIDSNEVQATHGSATGQLDANELFYLKSRGLNPETARFVLTYGFAKEVLEKIQNRTLREELETVVREGLEALFKRHFNAT